MDLEDKIPFIIIGIITVFILSIGGAVMLTSQPDPQPYYAPTAPPEPTITPTPTPTPTLTLENASNVKFGGQDDYNFSALQDYANNSILHGQTPNNYTPNLTGNGGVDYTRLADMYPWIKNGYADTSEYPWMWTPEKWRYMMNGQGDAQRIILYDQWELSQQVKAPLITLEIFHNDDKTPYDFNKEALVLGHTYDGYFRFTNNGDKPFQGNVAVVANASMFLFGGMVHMENVITEQYLSLYPGQSNDFYKRWEIKNYNNAPIPTGAFNIQIDIRDLSNGKTIYTMTVKPIVARDPNGDGYLSI